MLAILADTRLDALLSLSVRKKFVERHGQGVSSKSSTSSSTPTPATPFITNWKTVLVLPDGARLRPRAHRQLLAHRADACPVLALRAPPRDDALAPSVVGVPSASANLTPAYPVLELFFPASEKSPETGADTGSAWDIARSTTRPSRAATAPPGGPLLYARYCTPVRAVLGLHVLDLGSKDDMDAFHRWMNDERMNSGWGN
ncbi:hypothetical protein DFH11DRAFT_1733443 [Phellopilus nigrolimitatus]|nr:hypothetical protein DFH11DRAFT_1733443 [Phellopilus nigrolimitatus]